MSEYGENMSFADDGGEMDEHERRLRRLYAALRKVDTELDDLTAVVVANTYFEFYVRHLLSKNGVDLAKLEPNKDDPLNIAALIRIATSTKLMPDDVAKLLVGLARLRNKFAHNVDYALTQSDLDSLQSRLSRNQKSLWDFFFHDLTDDVAIRASLAHRLRTYILVMRVELEDIQDPAIPSFEQARLRHRSEGDNRRTKLSWGG